MLRKYRVCLAAAAFAFAAARLVTIDDRSLCRADAWSAATGVPGGHGAKVLDVAMYRHQLFGACAAVKAPTKRVLDTIPFADEPPVLWLLVRDVGPGQVMLLSDSGKPLMVDKSREPWRVVECEQGAMGTVWDVEVSENRRAAQERPRSVLWSIRHKGKKYYLSHSAGAAKPDHVVRTPEALLELYPMILSEQPPIRLYLGYGDSPKKAP